MKLRRKKEWYDDDSLWRELYPVLFPEQKFADAVVQVDKALVLTKPQGKSALDLCCGPGRCSIALAKRGFSVTGLDRTKYFLDKARVKARAAGVKIEWVRSDMRDFVRPGSFDLVLNMWTSFGYFEHREEDVVVLAQMFASLRPGGIFLIDVMSKECLAKVFQPTTAETLPDGTLFVQQHTVFEDWNRARNRWTLIRQGRARTFDFHLNLYSGQELRERMEQTGFVDVKLYGNLDGDEYGPKAQRLFILGRKPKIQSSPKRSKSSSVGSR